MLSFGGDGWCCQNGLFSAIYPKFGFDKMDNRRDFIGNCGCVAFVGNVALKFFINYGYHLSNLIGCIT